MITYEIRVKLAIKHCKSLQSKLKLNRVLPGGNSISVQKSPLLPVAYQRAKNHIYVEQNGITWTVLNLNYV